MSKTDLALRAASILTQGGRLINTFASLPFFDQALGIVETIVVIVETAEHNKQTCKRLKERVCTAQENINRFSREQIERNMAFRNYVNVIAEIGEFIDKISNVSGFMKFINAQQVKDDYLVISKRFDESMKELNLDTVLRTKAELDEDIRALSGDLNEIKQYLTNINDGVTGMGDKLDIFIAEFRDSIKAKEVKPDLLEASKIDTNEVRDPTDENLALVIRPGSSISLKSWRQLDAADKDFGIVSPATRAEIEREVAIVKQLDRCKYIIQFFGTYQRAGRLHLLMEFAHHGNLEDYMKKEELDWKTRLNIAVDISRGMCFLHEIAVLHHDMRTSNIMLTDTNQAKIANFRSSRKDTENTRPITEGMARLRWVAPEKLNNPDEPYTKRCDVYSFGMVLYHISSGNRPLAKYNDFDAYNEVVAGTRDEVIPDTPGGYANIMTQAWNADPKKRPTITDMFKELKKAADTYVPPKPSIMHSPSGFIYPTPQTPRLEDDLNNLNISAQQPNEDEDDDELGIHISTQAMIPLEEGLHLHKAKKYEEAWTCFFQHAQMDEPDGNYWVGYYLTRGMGGQAKDQSAAVRHYRLAANAGHVDAMLRYGAALMTADGVPRDSKEGFKYVLKAADQGNMAAQFNVGDILFGGSINGIPKDIEKGKKYLKMAASQGHPNAKKLCDKWGIQ